MTQKGLTGSGKYPINDEDTGLLESHESRTAATAPQRLPASSIQRTHTRGAYMAMYQFDTEEAALFGVDESIMLTNLRFWIKKNQANNRHLYEGRYWTYNSVKAFADLFIFWNEKKVQRILQSLESSGAITCGNFNKVSYDRTKWYSINEQSIYQKRQIHFPNLSNGLPESVQPIPDINTNINTDINTDVCCQQRFQKPTIEEISSYTKERAAAGKPLVNAEKFFHHYEAVGWKVGKSPMKNWKAAVHTWESNEKPVQKAKPEVQAQQVNRCPSF